MCDEDSEDEEAEAAAVLGYADGRVEYVLGYDSCVDEHSDAMFEGLDSDTTVTHAVHLLVFSDFIIPCSRPSLWGHPSSAVCAHLRPTWMIPPRSMWRVDSARTT